MVNKIKNNNRHLNDVIVDSYNNLSNFFKNNKGIFIEIGIGATKYILANKIANYTGSHSLLFMLANDVSEVSYLQAAASSVVTYMYFSSIVDVSCGAIWRPISNIFVNRTVDWRIRNKIITPEEKEKDKNKLQLYKNNEVAYTEKIFFDLFKMVYSTYKRMKRLETKKHL